MMTKEVYSAPAVETLGSFEALTQSTAAGPNTDFAYAAQAPSTLGALS